MERSKISARSWALLVVAIGLHLVAGVFILASGLVAPFPAVALLLLIWAVLGAVGLRNRRRPVVAEQRGGAWQATFEGECGRPYKYTVQMKGSQIGDTVMFQGTADLGEKDGGVVDWIGRVAR